MDDCDIAENYKLPTDSVEMDRLEVQHKMWRLLLGGLYPPSLDHTVQEILRRKDHDGTVPWILDLGCGSGIWALEMAKEFSEAVVIGFDLKEQSYHNAPNNFRFVQGDLTTDLPEEFRNKFTIVHCRCVAQHVSDPHELVRGISQCLKPGGLIFLADGDWVAFDEQKRILTPFRWVRDVEEKVQLHNTQGHSWYAGWLELFGSITRSSKYRTVDILLEESGAFNGIQYKKLFSPINWSGVGIQHGAQVGEIMSKNMKEFFDGGVPIILDRGVSPTLMEAWKAGFMRELDDHLYNIWHFSFGTKLAEPGR